MRNYLVTGCTSGIGLGLTAELIRRGERVWGVGLEKNGLETLRPEFETGRFHYSVCDVTRPEEIRSAVSEMDMKKFKPDIVILNAGINPERFGVPFSLEQFEEVMRVNVFGALAWVGVYLPVFKVGKSGQFVAISSLSAYHGVAGLTGYCASKAALDRAFESLRAEHSDGGITFTTVNLHTVAVGMGLEKRSLLKLSLRGAVHGILKAVEKKEKVISLPWYLGSVAGIVQLFPEKIYSLLRRRL